MAEPCTRYSSCHNPPPEGEDELIGGLPRAPIKSSNSPTPSPAISQALIPAPALASTPVSALASTLALPSNNELFKQFMKAYLKFNQGPI